MSGADRARLQRLFDNRRHLVGEVAWLTPTTLCHFPKTDDIVVNCMNVIIGSVGRSRYTGCLSPVYYVLTRRSEADNPRYLAAIFSTKPFHESLVRIGNGILAHRMRIPMELLKCEPFPLPPPDEQAAMVRFLDWANGRLERAIRAKRQVIALVAEQKQAIIHRAVMGKDEVRRR
jgi:type I restriction enzyme S subunit